MTADTTLRLMETLHDGDDEPLTPERYKAVFRRHPAGVAVITLRYNGRPVGFTATSVISVSAAPPFLAFSLASSSSSWPAISAARSLAVNFLSAEQGRISARFATSGIDRFADGGWRPLPTGEPVIDEAVSWVRGRIIERTPVGDSYLISVGAVDSGTRADAAPLVYHDRTYHRIGEHSAL
jgi:flavin reductase (DIM6/NTAB) family NADH-FMN oxidoreductase RutF